MKNPPARPSATSLPASPDDDAHSRTVRYLIMMGIRVACFILMVVVTPYGWYSWVFAAGAIFLPYFAVVVANVSQNVRRKEPESPEKALPETPSAPHPSTDIIRIEERRELDEGGER